MTVTELVALMEVLGVPASILVAAFLLRAGTLNAGNDVASHVDGLKAELAALKTMLNQIDEKRHRDVQRLHQDLEQIRAAISDHKIRVESRLTRMETKINGQGGVA